MRVRAEVPAGRATIIIDRSLGTCEQVMAGMTDAKLLERTAGPYIRASHLKGLAPPSSAGLSETH